MPAQQASITNLFPSANNIGSLSTGDFLSEENMVRWATGFDPEYNFAISGLTRDSSSLLTVTILGGGAKIAGYNIRVPAQTITVNASETNQQWYLELDFDVGNNVTGASWDRVLDASPNPFQSAFRCYMFVVTTDATSILTFESRLRSAPGVDVGEYTGDGTDLRLISLGYKPVWVVVQGEGTASQSDLIGFSGIFDEATLSPGLTANPTSTVIQADALFRPKINELGFEVSGISSGRTLNFSGDDYRYAAFR